MGDPLTDGDFKRYFQIHDKSHILNHVIGGFNELDGILAALITFIGDKVIKPEGDADEATVEAKSGSASVPNSKKKTK